MAGGVESDMEYLSSHEMKISNFTPSHENYPIEKSNDLIFGTGIVRDGRG